MHSYMYFQFKKKLNVKQYLRSTLFEDEYQQETEWEHHDVTQERQHHFLPAKGGNPLTGVTGVGGLQHPVPHGIHPHKHVQEGDCHGGALHAGEAAVCWTVQDRHPQVTVCHAVGHCMTEHSGKSLDFRGT